MRTTRTKLDHYVKTLNAVLHRPELQWQLNTPAGENRMNIGHLMLEHNAYGYQLVEIRNEGGATKAWSDCMTPGGMNEYIMGVMNGISLRNERTTREANGGQFL